MPKVALLKRGYKSAKEIQLRIANISRRLPCFQLLWGIIPAMKSELAGMGIELESGLFGWNMVNREDYERETDPNSEDGARGYQGRIGEALTGPNSDPMRAIMMIGVAQTFFLKNTKKPTEVRSLEQVKKAMAVAEAEKRMWSGITTTPENFWFHELAHWKRARNHGVRGNIVFATSRGTPVAVTLWHIGDLRQKVLDGGCLQYILGSSRIAPLIEGCFHEKNEDKRAVELLLWSEKCGVKLTESELSIVAPFREMI